MIKANELRVGNLLNYQTAEADVVTCQTDFGTIQWATEDPKGFNLVHTPIPLTEEWLVKIGFEKIVWDDFTFFRKKGLDIEIHDGGFYANRKIENVHTLQNLYFALTGEELTPLH